MSESNSDKIILDLCGGTGSWSKPYVAAGYDVRLITLPDHDVLKYTPLDKVHGILAAPPCEKFSFANCEVFEERDFEDALAVVEACLRIIWKCQLENQLAWWCMENPTGYLRRFLGRPANTVFFWWFGDKRFKRTDLWGYFNVPKRKVGRPRKLTGHHKIQSENGKNRKIVRSITPPGFAEAFFKANP